MIHRCFAILTKALREVVGGSVDVQYLVGSVSSGPFDQHPLFRVWFRLPLISMRRTDSNGGKAGSQFTLRTFTPGDLLKGCSRQAHRQLLHGNGLMVRRSLQ